MRWAAGSPKELEFGPIHPINSSVLNLENKSQPHTCCVCFLPFNWFWQVQFKLSRQSHPLGIKIFIRMVSGCHFLYDSFERNEKAPSPYPYTEDVHRNNPCYNTSLRPTTILILRESPNVYPGSDQL